MQNNDMFNLSILDDVYYKADINGIILEISPSIQKLLGYEQKELLGTRLDHLYVDPETVRKKFQKVDKGQDDFTLEVFLKHKNGKHIPISSHFHFIKDAQGNIVGREGLARDISRENDIKNRLISSEKKYRTIFENSPSGIIYFDSKGIIIEANHSALKTFGVTKKQFIGFDLLHQLVDKDLKNAVEESLRSGKAHYKGFYISVLKNKKIYLEVFFNAVRDENNNIVSVTASLEDQTVKTKALQNLEKSREEWKSIIDNIQDIFVQTDVNGVIIKVSPSIRKIAGYEIEEVLGRNISVFRADAEEAEYFRKKYVEHPTHITHLIVPFFHKNGSVIYLDVNVSPRFDKDHRFIGSDNFAKDITVLKKSQEKIEHMALHDALTNLPNRTMLSNMLENSIKRARRTREKIAVLFLDLDNFKNINDNFGHLEGDRVLVVASEQFKKILRQDDEVYRFGGDEFVIVLEHVKYEEDIVKVVKKINNIFTNPIKTKSHTHYLGCCIGIAMYPDDAKTAETLVKDADTAVYKAKTNGKSRYEFYAKELGQRIEQEQHIERLLRKAIENDEFELYYQPQISLSDEKVTGVEALIRWNSPELGFTKPVDFVSIAEKMQLVIPIGKWVLRTACKQVKDWHDRGLYGGNISVNISGVQITNDDITVLLRDVLKDSGLDARFLDLEITESTIMDYWKSKISVFDKIKDMGVDISIDDFGSGYSSLSYIRKNPVDKLKIDKSFIDGLPFDKNACAIVDTIITLVKSLGNKSVAEGVETEAQVEYLKKHGCDIIQGYYYSKPLNIYDIEEYFKRNL